MADETDPPPDQRNDAPPADGDSADDGSLFGRAASAVHGASNTLYGLASARISTSLSILLFTFGAAAGFMVAFSGLGIINDITGIILLSGLVALLFVGAFALLAVLFRKPLLRRLFGFAETQVETFAGPLAEVAQSAVKRDPQKATDAARELVQLSLARYAWLSTRRWIIGAMTALIAAIAALAGTSLLYRQNQLLEAQSGLLVQQNERLAEQSLLIEQSVELAEAARNAELAVEITAIASALGEVVDRAVAEQQQELTADGSLSNSQEFAGLAPDLQRLALRLSILDPMQDLDQSLIMRIASASRAAKPYRFLNPGFEIHNSDDRERIAILSRREDLPQAYERFATTRSWDEPQDGSTLIDRPASPERGQLLEVLARSGVQNFDPLTFFGLDLSFAHAPGLQMVFPTIQLGQLNFADLSFSSINDGNFAASSLDNIRFKHAVLQNISFDSPTISGVQGIFATAAGSHSPTRLFGADFSNAAIFSSSFERVAGLAMNWDRAAIDNVRFSDADIAGSTFRNAALIDVDFSKANLRSVDFDGAFVFGENALQEIADTAAAGAFDISRFALQPAEASDLFLLESIFRHHDHARINALIESQGLFRVERLRDFD